MSELKPEANIEQLFTPPAMIRIETVYIAGPMRGYARWNFPAFDLATDIWSREGFKVISPAAVDRAMGFDPDGPAEQVDEAFIRRALARDAAFVCESDAVAVLPGWFNSKGARAEVALARAIGMPIFDALTGRPVPFFRET